MDRIGAREFLGRDVELAVLERAVADARAGVPSVLLIDGDAGIGKSSLVAEAADRAHVPLMLGRSAHIGGDVIPLAPSSRSMTPVTTSRSISPVSSSQRSAACSRSALHQGDLRDHSS